MKLLADENVPGLAVAQLRAAGHDVVWALTDHPADDDERLMQVAHDQQRLIVTFDKDFGELVFRRGTRSLGVVLLRISLTDPVSVSHTIVNLLASRDDWWNHFSVVQEDRIRMTPLPPNHPPRSAQ